MPELEIKRKNKPADHRDSVKCQQTDDGLELNFVFFGQGSGQWISSRVELLHQGAVVAQTGVTMLVCAQGSGVTGRKKRTLQQQQQQQQQPADQELRDLLAIADSLLPPAADAELVLEDLVDDLDAAVALLCAPVAEAALPAGQPADQDLHDLQAIADLWLPPAADAVLLPFEDDHVGAAIELLDAPAAEAVPPVEQQADQELHDLAMADLLLPAAAFAVLSFEDYHVGAAIELLDAPAAEAAPPVEQQVDQELHDLAMANLLLPPAACAVLSFEDDHVGAAIELLDAPAAEAAPPTDNFAAACCDNMVPSCPFCIQSCCLMW